MTTSLSGSRGPAGSSSGGRTTGGNIIPKGYQQGQLSQFTPEQSQLFQHLFSQVGPQSFLGKLGSGDQSQFEQLEAPAHRQFGQLQSQIANRFSQQAPGALSSRRGSGFSNYSNQAASDFAQDLQSRRVGLQQQALQQMMGISESLLGQRPYEHFLTPKKKPFWKELLGSLSGGIGQAGGTLGGFGLAKQFGLLGGQ